MTDVSVIVAALTPGVALTSAVLYWANLQSRLDALAQRTRMLNAELRAASQPSQRTESVARQVQMLITRTRVLHMGVVLSVVALIGFIGSSAALFANAAASNVSDWIAPRLFMVGLGAFGSSLLTTLWEMLWARRSLEEDVRSSREP